MANIAFQFDKKKAVEAILYLTPRVSKPDVYDICKLLYIADKTSLEKYGRFVFGESYFALPEGATPSNAYDLLKRAWDRPIDGIRVLKEGKVVSLREPDLDYLSESDIECLDQTIGKFGKASVNDKKKEAHDVAWQKAWDTRGKKRSARMPTESIAELFAGADDLIGYLSNTDTG